MTNHICRLEPEHKCSAGYQMEDVTCPVHTEWHVTVQRLLSEYKDMSQSQLEEKIILNLTDEEIRAIFSP